MDAADKLDLPLEEMNSSTVASTTNLIVADALQNNASTIDVKIVDTPEVN